ncbi:4a-hydroxytetrahydrobiopterin dehydratase [Corynebacterium halotolerans]|uniref:Putative pterin-4-alpha-carbinolamine dehydratase n=1 Tax=Corynebacterium halotolerans YIM 70093 = DSM 44683 TaxID=1121362 RepID=M1NJ97_9CORY|nr:4a-hydroxytetrahydrobiopterin dehydratase [Corynebacterium halotolerans]AGF71468.1 pterin-4-alpha-carbinolamine dehydratase [Corynebacterium halotolerans YIM 70093 = DSM 44683]
MSDPKQKLTPQQIEDAALTGWRQADQTIRAEFDTGDFATGLRLVNLIGESAETANHHPDLTLTYPSVAVTLSSHDVNGLTSRDVDLARTINRHAAELGVEAKEG